DATIFLALWWGGAAARTLSEIIWLCDWVEREIPTAAELDGALNRLIACDLVVACAGRFRIPARVGRKFDAFRRRRRRGRFLMAADFVQTAGPLRLVARRVTIGPRDQKRAYAEYLELFPAATGASRARETKKHSRVRRSRAGSARTSDRREVRRRGTSPGLG